MQDFIVPIVYLRRKGKGALAEATVETVERQIRCVVEDFVTCLQLSRDVAFMINHRAGCLKQLLVIC
jgi:predicted RNase H-related nuclease YkuK (DUF458 family)